MIHSDIKSIAASFAHRNKTVEQYESYFAEYQQGDRVTLVAVVGEKVVGYSNILWRSDYIPYQEAGIPEINDLNVVEEFQNLGIGRALIRESERLVAERGIQRIGIGVGLTPDYAAAQYLYPKLGYVLDGRGLRLTQFGEAMYFIKELVDS
jgi:GNAT superfamily N-acetyltransferase